MEKTSKRFLSAFLTLCLLAGLAPAPVKAAEITGGLFDPKSGNMTLEFGYQTTQYVNINVYVRSPSDAGMTKEFVGRIAENYLITGAGDLASHQPEDDPETMTAPFTPVTHTDGGLLSLTDDGVYQTDKNFAGEPITPVDMMQHTLVWDGSLDGIPIIGPDLDEDVFYLTVEIEPLGRPDLNEECTEETVGEGDEAETVHTHGKNYTWTHKTAFAVSTELLVDYRDYLVDENGTAAFLMLGGSLSDTVAKSLYEQFCSGSIACKDNTEVPILSELTLDYDGLDPINMVTGAYNFMYSDLRLEGAIPLTFLRVYNSRYDGGGAADGDTQPRRDACRRADLQRQRTHHDTGRGGFPRAGVERRAHRVGHGQRGQDGLLYLRRRPADRRGKPRRRHAALHL